MKSRVNFDGLLKEFFERRRPSLLMELTGGVPVKESLNVELPRVLDRKADLVLRLADDSLLHIELQTSNHKDMALRMAEYYLLLYGRYRRPIRQVVIYVGQPRMRMRSGLDLGTMQFSYTLRDIREWPAEAFLEGESPADPVLAILGATSNAPELVRRILRRVARMSPPQREAALSYLAALSGLRRFATILEREAAQMSVVIDFRKDPVLWRVWNEMRQKGLEEGLEQGLEQGREEGKLRGMRLMLRNNLTVAFGKLPAWASDKIERGTEKQLLAWNARTPTAKRLEDVIRRPKSERTARLVTRPRAHT